jgi:hypothetical protein
LDEPRRLEPTVYVSLWERGFARELERLRGGDPAARGGETAAHDGDDDPS